MDAKGRNGYFKVAKVDIWKNLGPEHNETHIEIFSRREPSGNVGPCRIVGTTKEMKGLVKSLSIAMNGESKAFSRTILLIK